MLKIYHYASLTESERKRLNSSEGGWDSEPRFSRYADITHRGKVEAVLQGLLQNEYRLVAVVDTDDLEAGFSLTNHIDYDWAINNEVTALPGSHRSTSVGDIIVRGDSTYIVASCGFTKLGEAPKQKPLGRIEYLSYPPCDNLSVFDKEVTDNKRSWLDDDLVEYE